MSAVVTTAHVERHARRVLPEVVVADAGVRLHDETGLGAVDARLPRALVGDLHYLALPVPHDLGHEFAHGPDIAVLVLGVIVPRRLARLAPGIVRVVDDQRLDAVDLFVLVGDADIIPGQGEGARRLVKLPNLPT